MNSAPLTGALPAAGPTPSALRQQAEELEGVFLNTLMSQMFSSLDTEGDFGGGYAEETWRSMQAEHYADALAKAGGVGLADALVRQLLEHQESQPLAAPAARSY